MNRCLLAVKKIRNWAICTSNFREFDFFMAIECVSKHNHDLRTMLTQEFIPVERSMRYTLRAASSQTEILVYLLHGYGQLTEFFIRKVADVLPETVTLVAPEGMHRFYLEGTSGRVGASWMTREMRETDIVENTRSLDQLHKHLVQQFHPEKILVIGFSQGGATATRWIANGNIVPDGFVSWASVFPPDISNATGFGDKSFKKWFVLGDEDPYFTKESAAECCQFYAESGFEVLHFHGQHVLDKPIIERLILSL